MRAPDDRMMEAATPDAASMDAADRPGAADTAEAQTGPGPDAKADASASTPGSGGEPVLHRQVERYRPWYRRERRAAAGLIVISMGTIGASAGLFTWTVG